jgi:hypothetical protein
MLLTKVRSNIKFRNFCYFFSIIFLILTIVLKEKGGADDLFIFFIATVISFLSIGITYNIKIDSDLEAIKTLHQAIGGYVPSDELSLLVRNKFLSCHESVTRFTNFAWDWNDTQKLLSIVDSHSFEINIAKGKVKCVISRNGNTYCAVSASKEMSLCIAFLKSCNVEV